MAAVLVIHGPNLNLLGGREPEHYGSDTLPAINERLMKQGAENGHDVVCFQSNAEHEIVDRIQQGGADGCDFVIINPAAFTHTSVAIRDALSAVGLPFIEVHLSNVFAREDFRHHSYVSDLAQGVIAGLGPQGYEFALQAALGSLAANSDS